MARRDERMDDEGADRTMAAGGSDEDAMMEGEGGAGSTGRRQGGGRKGGARKSAGLGRAKKGGRAGGAARKRR